MQTLNKITKKCRQLPLLIALASVSVLPACSWFSVYKIDIPQGTPISDAKLASVQVGMTANQVLYLLGSPALQDTLNPNRWDYLYDFTAGTVAKREQKPSIHNASYYVKIYFDEAGKVSKIERPNQP